MMKYLLIVIVAATGLLGWMATSADAGNPKVEIRADRPSELANANAQERAAIRHCNGMIRNSMGALRQIERGYRLQRNCTRVVETLNRLYFGHCDQLFEEGKLETNRHRPGSSERELICEAVVYKCGLELPPGACD